jgi:hypothetical protein
MHERCNKYSYFENLLSSLLFFMLLINVKFEWWLKNFEEFFTKSKWSIFQLNVVVKEFEKPNSMITIIFALYLNY